MQKIIHPLLSFLILWSTFISCNPQQEDPKDQFRITSGSKISVYMDSGADDLIRWAGNDLAEGLGKILGREININFTDVYQPDSKGIYIGTVGDALTGSLPADLSVPLNGQWERFSIQVDQGNLLITGSDIRGTVFGVSDFAEQIGLSPWAWWADVTPIERGSVVLELPPGGLEQGPSVKYRGIFLNDEDWGLQPWAANTFESETGDIGPRTYEKIFQLLLKLKANTIWPAMHPCTRGFFTIPGNKEMAEKYHIFIGTSHAEPMLRNNVYEWDEHTYGEFNYFTNSEQVKKYWQQRTDDLNDWEYIFTLGMRGIHDSGMEGDADTEEKVEMLEKIINDQREILVKSLGKAIGDIPQVFIPYKEVLPLYDAGLELPEDITLMWTDDNYGYIRRLSDASEQKRTGGNGIYYHLSYWGRPHDYLWLSTTQPGLIWYEMSRAYQNGARMIWICNVGDIKPAEYNMEFFLDLAWDIHSISENTIEAHLTSWCNREFGKDRGSAIAAVLQEYYRLAFLRKPEFMGWSTTEPTTPIRISEFTTANRNELQRRIDSYSVLYDKVDQISKLIPTERGDAYFQLISYPVRCAALMNYKFLYAQQALLVKDPGEKAQLNHMSRSAYEEIELLTNIYNHEIADGKWNLMMSMKPRELPVFDLPVFDVPDSGYIRGAYDSTLDASPGPIFLQAYEYTGKSDPGEFEWKPVEGLGTSDSSMTLFPFDQHIFTDDEPYLEYSFNVEKPGNYEIEVRCLPAHSNHFDYIIRMEVNRIRSEGFPINTIGRSETWKKDVLRNYHSVTYPVTLDQPGTQLLKVFVNQTGIVLDQIAVNPQGCSKYYEIMK